MKKNQGKILYSLLTVSILPLLFSVLLILILGYYFFTRTMYQEIRQEMENATQYAIYMLDAVYPGDYTLVEDSRLHVYKGETDITQNYEIVDVLKENFNYDVSLFYQDTRILTTVTGSDGNRRIGSGVPETVLQDISADSLPHFYDNVNILGTPCLTCYTPLFNSDGTYAGILAVGRPQNAVDSRVKSTVFPLALIMIGIIILMAVGIYLYANGIVKSFVKIRNFLLEASDGNLNAELDNSVTIRNDEIGQVAQSILSMQRSMRSMVELDTLTGLFNRRSANRKIASIMSKHASSGTPFSLALGDIDFFKRINDTYGHDCGDMVLKAVSETLRKHMHACGFASRWGGEEFLLVFDHFDLYDASVSADSLLKEIRAIEVLYEGQIIKLTMTFGIVAGEDIPFKDLVCKADRLLYKGKESGRNQVVVEQSELHSFPQPDVSVSHPETEPEQPIPNEDLIELSDEDPLTMDLKRDPLELLDQLNRE